MSDSLCLEIGGELRCWQVVSNRNPVMHLEVPGNVILMLEWELPIAFLDVCTPLPGESKDDYLRAKQMGCKGMNRWVDVEVNDLGIASKSKHWYWRLWWFISDPFYGK